VGQSVRQVARRQALEAQAKRRAERGDAERRRSELGVKVVVALAARDDAVERLEREAGVALASLTGDEGLTVAEACEWAGDLTVADVKRLIKLKPDGNEGAEVAGGGARHPEAGRL